MSEPYLEVVDAAALARRVSELGEAIAADYADLNPVLVGVLQGAVPFHESNLVLGLEAEPPHLAGEKHAEQAHGHE